MIITSTQPAICRVCTALCPILVETENGVVTRVTGDPDNSLYQGYTCPKGRALNRTSAKYTEPQAKDFALRAIMAIAPGTSRRK